MKIRHEAPKSEIERQVGAPLCLELSSGERIAVSQWSLEGLTYPEIVDVLPKEAVLCIPFQGIDIRFPVKLASDPGSLFLRFEGLTGRHRETLAVFYRSLLSGRMASTEEVITSLDTPVDLVPMGETEEEKASGQRKVAPRVLRIIWSLFVYTMLAVFAFGVMGGQIASMLDRIDMDRGRVITPLVPHISPAATFVRDIRVSPGTFVKAGDILMVLGDAALDADIAATEHERADVSARLEKARAAMETLATAMGQRGAKALGATARYTLAARYQTEFFADDDTSRMHRLWVVLRDQNPKMARVFSPDIVMIERLTLLIETLERRRMDLLETEALNKDRQNEITLRALTDGIVTETLAYEGQFVSRRDMLMTIEEDTPREMLGWVSAEVADRVHLGQRVSITYASGDALIEAEGRVAHIIAGPDPGQPNAFGMLVSVAPIGMNAKEMRQTYPIDAPVRMVIHRDRFTKMHDGAKDIIAAAWDHFQ